MTGPLFLAIYTRCKNAGSVVSAFPGWTRSATGTVYPVGVYAGQAPDGAPLPYVVSTMIAAPSQQMYGGVRTGEITVEFAAYGVGHDATYNAFLNLLAVLDNTLLSLSTGQQYFVLRTSEPVSRWEELDADSNDVFRWDVEYQFNVRA